ncbi:MAG: adenylate kinase [Candidatus Woesearchaeota archaeon]|nr:adenylate kinase [Candidatus Woesearchaeota archaeon]
MKLLIMGPQASGKGTQAALIAKEFGLKHISTGDLFRAEVAGETELGKQVKELLDAGQLVPDSLTNEIAKKHIEAADGFILDGYPRTATQAAFLDTVTAIDKVLVLEVADETAMERIKGRGRSDDTEEALRNRLAQYHEQTKPLIEYYGEKVVRVDGEPGIEDVTKAIFAVLGA